MAHRNVKNKFKHVVQCVKILLVKNAHREVSSLEFSSSSRLQILHLIVGIIIWNAVEYSGRILPTFLRNILSQSSVLKSNPRKETAISGQQSIRPRKWRHYILPKRRGLLLDYMASYPAWFSQKLWRCRGNWVKFTKVPYVRMFEVASSSVDVRDRAWVVKTDVAPFRTLKSHFCDHLHLNVKLWRI
jgi:hypothetical protein